MLERIKSFIEEYELQDKTIIVGFSGGFDSMCLLDILSKIKQDNEFYDLNIISAHFNHNWRGEESLKEQEVCRLFSISRNFEFYTKTASKDLKKTENDARIARYKFFEEALKYYDADAIFTAHNKDDNAETVLYRIIKGTGLIGLKGIAENRDNFYRPLLKFSREEIEKYCEYNNLAPNIDSSNFDTKYSRNYLRLSVMPILEKINPTVKDSLNSLAEVAISENSIVEEYLSIIKKNLYINDKISTEQYRLLSKPVKMRLIYDYIQILNLDYDYNKINNLYNFIEENIDKRNGSTISLSNAKWLYADNKFIEVLPRRTQNSKYNDFIEVFTEGSYHFKNCIVNITKYNINNKPINYPLSTSNSAYVDLSKIKFPITIRNRQDGDIINPFGMSGSMKFKKYLNSKGVARQDRDNIIILASENEILWSVSVGLSNKVAVKDVPTHIIEVINNDEND